MEETGKPPADRHSALRWCARQCTQRGWRLACSLLRNSADAEDAVQQAFLVALRKPDDIPRDDPWPWFATVIALEARNVRRRYQRPQVSIDAGEEPMQLPDHRHTPAEDSLASRELAQQLAVALDELPGDEREALVLTQLGGMSYAESARALDVPLGTFNHRVSRGLQKLRKRMGAGDAAVLGCLPLLPVDEPPATLEPFLESKLAAAGGSAVPATVIIAGIAMKKTVLLVSLLVLLLLGLGALVAVLKPADPLPMQGRAASGPAPQVPSGARAENAPVSQREPTPGTATDPSANAAHDAAQPAEGGPAPRATDEDIDDEEELEDSWPVSRPDREPVIRPVQTARLDTRIVHAIGDGEPWTLHEEPHTLLVSPDDSFVIAAARQSVQCLDARSGETIWALSIEPFPLDAVALSPDGTRLAAATYERVVMLDAATGRRLEGEDVMSSAGALAWSPDGRRLAVAHRRGVEVFELQGARSLFRHRFGNTPWVLRDPVRRVRFSDDGMRLLCARLEGHSEENALQVLDAESGELLGSVRVTELGLAAAGSLVLAGDGSHAVLEAMDGAEFVMSFDEFTEIHPIGGREEELDEVYRRRRKEYAEYLATKGLKEEPVNRQVARFAAVINVADGKLEKRVGLPGNRVRFALSGDGGTLAAWSAGFARILDFGVWSERATAAIATSSTALAFNRRGDVLFCSDGLRLRRIGVNDGRELEPEAHLGLKPDGKYLCLSADGKVALFTEDQGLVAFDFSSRKVLWRSQDLRPSCSANSFSGDGSCVFALRRPANQPLLLDTFTGEVTRELAWPEGVKPSQNIVVSGDGSTVAAVCEPTEGEFWTHAVLWRQSQDYRPLVLQVDGTTRFGMMGQLELNHDATRGATPAWEGFIVWDFTVETFRVVKTPQGFMNNTTLRMTPDGTQLLAVAMTQKPQFWRIDLATDVATNVKIAHGKEGEYGEFRDFLLAPDGKSLLMAPRGKNLSILRVELESGKVLDQFPGHRDTIERLARSADGSVMASVSEDGVLYFWRME